MGMHIEISLSHPFPNQPATSVPDYSCSFTSASLLNKNALWHARVGHPHVKALNLMVPGVVFENKDCYLDFSSMNVTKYL